MISASFASLILASIFRLYLPKSKSTSAKFSLALGLRHCLFFGLALAVAAAAGNNPRALTPESG
jgi:hypothetical protein